jgi:4-amino-4-deoxy-L-arabinose transferase-like glycosyltransferase
MDRDEARFAQASKQMLETGNLVDIRFQDVPRYKKPAGIYWFQGASAALAGPPYDRIWAYRLPSLLGAIAAVLLTFWAGTPLFGRRAAFLGATLLAGTIMLGAEARLAKTDAALLACVVLAQGSLARLYSGDKRLTPALLFWAAQGLGILIKGPIAPLISLLTIAALAIWDRRADWLRALRPHLGLPLMLLMVAPWLIAIGFASHGQFFTDAVGNDMAQKLAGGQESHGAPPGYYFIAAIVTFWPATLFLLPALGHAFHERTAPAFRFALAWALPAWLFFELVPSKLPHYVLPAYPALTLLCGAAILAAMEEGTRPFGKILSGLARAGFAVGAVLFIALLAGLQRLADGVYHLGDIALALLVIPLAVLADLAFRRKRYDRAAAVALACSAVVTAGALGVVGPGLDAPFVAPRLVAALPRTPQGHLPRLVISGYSEPSLVFLAGTGTLIVPSGTRAAETLALSSDSNIVAAVSAEADPAFRAEMAQLHLHFPAIGRISGFNYSIGKPVTLILYKARP